MHRRPTTSNRREDVDERRCRTAHSRRINRPYFRLKAAREAERIQAVSKITCRPFRPHRVTFSKQLTVNSVIPRRI